MKKILFFGIYDPNYSRNKILIRGFKENGYEVIECSVDPKQFQGIKKYRELIRKYKTIRGHTFEAIIVGFPGHSVMWLAYILFGSKVTFDAFVSLYDSNVNDRKKYHSFSLRAFRDFFLDWYSLRCAQWVLLDTEAHIDYFTQQFKIARKKCIRVFVGADDAVFYPQEIKREDPRFTVYFHGSFIPLQGIEYIIEAAALLRSEDIFFTIIGNGQEFKKIEMLVKEKKLESIVKFLGMKPLQDLPYYMQKSDVCLGIFGNTSKAERVIPNKVFEAVAAGRPVITARTRAMQEIFKEDETMVFCSRANGADLAEKIRFVKNNKEKAKHIADNAYQLFQNKLLPRHIVNDLLHHIIHS